MRNARENLRAVADEALAAEIREAVLALVLETGGFAMESGAVAAE